MKNKIFIPNPFTAGQPVWGKNFIDRLDAIKSLNSFANSNRYNCFILIGQRRIGKTSLLRHFEFLNQNNKNFAVEYINLQNHIDSKLENLKKLIQNSIAAKLKKNLQENFFATLSETQNTDKKLILLFDEFDAYYYYENADKNSVINYYKFFYEFADYINKNSLKIKIVFAIAPYFQIKEPKYFQDLMNFSKKYNLNYFHPIKIQELLDLAKPHLTFTNKAIKFIYFLSSGHPLFSQCMAAYSFKYAQANKLQVIDFDDLRKILPKTLKTYENNLLWIWESFSKSQQSILICLTDLKSQNNKTSFEDIENCTKIPSTQLKVAIDNLMKYKYIKLYKGQYYIRAKFLSLWIKKNFLDKNK